MKDLIHKLDACLPPILWRHKWSLYEENCGVPFARGTMANKDSMGLGPKANHLKKRVYYTKENYLDWLEQEVMQ